MNYYLISYTIGEIPHQDIIIGEKETDKHIFLLASTNADKCRMFVNWSQAQEITRKDLYLYISFEYKSPEFEAILKGERVQDDLLMALWGDT